MTDRGDAAGRMEPRATATHAASPGWREYALPGSLLALGILAATLLGSGRAAERGRSPGVVRDRRESRRGYPPVERREIVDRSAARRLYLGSSALSFSVVADSSMEHYRGGFYNPAMYVGPSVAAVTLAASLAAARDRGRGGRLRGAIFTAASISGLVGAGFHAFNVSRREGGWSWLNLLYGAPLAAPMGITFAGVLGAAATRVSGGARTLLGRPAGRALAIASALGLVGTAVEAGLLHFRGAFQDPFMYIPVVVPPAAALALAGAALRPGRRPRTLARALLTTTAAAGIAGMGFHGYGIHRNMGGWYNWSQMLQQGPPLPAPPSFTGMALAGLAALDLVQEETRG